MLQKYWYKTYIYLQRVTELHIAVCCHLLFHLFLPQLFSLDLLYFEHSPSLILCILLNSFNVCIPIWLCAFITTVQSPIIQKVSTHVLDLLRHPVCNISVYLELVLPGALTKRTGSNFAQSSQSALLFQEGLECFPLFMDLKRSVTQGRTDPHMTKVQVSEFKE